MKTPREILLGQHRDANAKLDAIRTKVVAGCHNKRFAAMPARWLATMADVPLLLWRELILPSRRVWAGFAVAWVLILAVNYTLRDPAPPAGRAANASTPTMMTFQQQQKLLNELLADRSLAGDADRPKTLPPRPHSERSARVMT